MYYFKAADKKEHSLKNKWVQYIESPFKDSLNNKPYDGKSWGSMTKTEVKVRTVFVHEPNEHDIEYDTCVYPFTSKLKPISDAIKEAEAVLKYTDDWDEDRALATNLPTFEKAVDFVHKYSNYILKCFNTVIETPFIDIMRDGGISITWNTKRGKMAIIFKKDDSSRAYYFIEDTISKIASNSWIIIGDKPYKTLAVWMEEFLVANPNQDKK